MKEEKVQRLKDMFTTYLRFKNNKNVTFDVIDVPSKDDSIKFSFNYTKIMTEKQYFEFTTELVNLMEKYK
jgi:hypothetical protein